MLKMILPRNNTVLIVILVVALLQVWLQTARLQNLQKSALTTVTKDETLALSAPSSPALHPNPRTLPPPAMAPPPPPSLVVPKPVPKSSSATLLPQALPLPFIPYAGTRRKISTTTVIVTLTANGTKDLERLCTALDSLKFIPDAQNRSRPLAPVIIFHENNIPHQTLANFQNCTHRPLSFPLVDDYFDSYPPGFDPVHEPSPWPRRTKFGYAQMIRFFVTGLWKHPAIQGYETVMRLDNDASWNRRTLKNETFPDLPLDKVYHANNLSLDPPEFCRGIWKLAKNYIATNNISVANPNMWRQFDIYYRRQGQQCLNWYNNFEVVRVKFMQQPQVQHWHETVTEHEPFGVFRRRWGDAIIRYLTMTFFAEPGSLIATGQTPRGYQHNGVAVD
jgi:hypothetical protein